MGITGRFKEHHEVIQDRDELKRLVHEKPL
jgi:hypothetical protein